MRAIAARHQDEPCAAWLGTDGAGHFVKTIHNGIEYADMQMIAEIYGLLRDGFGWSAAEIAPVFGRWNEGPLRSYLVEITAEVLRTVDPTSGKALVDVIVDSAGQKGTGRWSAIEALPLAAPASAPCGETTASAPPPRPRWRRKDAEPLRVAGDLVREQPLSHSRPLKLTTGAGPVVLRRSGRPLRANCKAGFAEREKPGHRAASAAELRSAGTGRTVAARPPTPFAP